MDKEKMFSPDADENTSKIEYPIFKRKKNGTSEIENSNEQLDERFVKINNIAPEDIELIRELVELNLEENLTANVLTFHNFFAGNPEPERSARQLELLIIEAEEKKVYGEKTLGSSATDIDIILKFYKKLLILTEKYPGITMMGIIRGLEGEW